MALGGSIPKALFADAGPQEDLTRAELAQDEHWWQEQERNENAILFAPPVLCVIGEKE